MAREDTMDAGSTYPLAPGVRARREAFGLLFYHSGTTLLTFVRSGDLLELTPGREGLTVCGEGVRADRVIKTLQKKGLLSEPTPRL
jgi:putative mycofactocin binding protein MftB